METTKQIELRSEKVRNIIGQVPSVLLRYGISIIAFSILILIGVAAFIPYQPVIDSTMTISQDEKGTLHYSASISLEAMQKRSQLVFVTSDFMSELMLPTSFKIVTISDGMCVSVNKAHYVATLCPMEAFDQNVKLENTLTASAKIVLEKKSVLMWFIDKI
jgi:hypothetical protein